MNNHIPRGLRNCNPLNIRKSNTDWQGKVRGWNDPDFESFSDIFYGCRAAIVNLRSHLERDRKLMLRTTIASEITRWAPPSENDTVRYIEFVCNNMKMPPQTVIRFSDKSLVCCLLYWMARYENGMQADIHLSWFERAYAML